MSMRIRRRQVGAASYALVHANRWADRCPQTATCAAVLVAFAAWAQANLSQQDAETVDRINAICSRIRFPDIPAGLLQQYW